MVKSFGCCQEDSTRYSVLPYSEKETIQSVHPSSCTTDLDLRIQILDLKSNAKPEYGFQR